MAIVVFALVVVSGCVCVLLVVASIRQELHNERMGRWRAEVAHQRIYGTQTGGTPPAPAGLEAMAEAGIDDEGLFI